MEEPLLAAHESTIQSPVKTKKNNNKRSKDEVKMEILETRLQKEKLERELLELAVREKRLDIRKKELKLAKRERAERESGGSSIK